MGQTAVLLTKRGKDPTVTLKNALPPYPDRKNRGLVTSFELGETLDIDFTENSSDEDINQIQFP